MLPRIRLVSLVTPSLHCRQRGGEEESARQKRSEQPRPPLHPRERTAAAAPFACPLAAASPSAWIRTQWRRIQPQRRRTTSGAASKEKGERDTRPHWRRRSIGLRRKKRASGAAQGGERGGCRRAGRAREGKRAGRPEPALLCVLS
ncbi:hypothetical protein BS78_02G184100 [Paspalum vaginatum]|nr:hypothetical protein BS78_02G184100 [Paspalum vaginatum]